MPAKHIENLVQCICVTATNNSIDKSLILKEIEIVLTDGHTQINFSTFSEGGRLFILKWLCYNNGIKVILMIKFIPNYY